MVPACINKYLLTALCLLLSGCVLPLGSTYDYSKDWAPIKENDQKECVDFSGTYYFFGKRSYVDWSGDYPECELDTFVTLSVPRRYPLAFKANQTFQIKQDTCNSARITYTEQGRQYTIDCSPHSDQCEMDTDKIVLHQDSSYDGIYVEWGRNELYKTRDGALVSKRFYRQITTLIVPLLYVGHYRWCRFDQR